MWFKNIIIEVVVDVVWDVFGGGGGFMFVIVYIVKMLYDL